MEFIGMENFRAVIQIKGVITVKAALFKEMQ